MADTRIQVEAEDWIRRNWLPVKFNQQFLSLPVMRQLQAESMVQENVRRLGQIYFFYYLPKTFKKR
jgi:hypothetical protein